MWGQSVTEGHVSRRRLEEFVTEVLKLDLRHEGNVWVIAEPEQEGASLSPVAVLS